MAVTVAATVVVAVVVAAAVAVAGAVAAAVAFAVRIATRTDHCAIERGNELQVDHFLQDLPKRHHKVLS